MTCYDDPGRGPVENRIKELPEGQGKPVRQLLLLPGMDGTGLLLKPFMDCFGRGVEAHLFDYPTDEIQSYEEIINHVEAVLPRYGEDFVILAESFGGPIALSLAQRGVPGLRALILVVTFAATPRHFLLRLTRFLPMVRLLGMPVPRRFARRMMLGSKAPEETLDSLLEVFNMIDPAVFVSRLDEMWSLRLPQETIDLPALYIQATNDRLLPDNAVDDIKALMPRLEIDRIEGPHMVLEVHPQTCARLVAGFLESLD
jgi:pimeloyl-ACP methyl ester carboxylesterase